MPPFAIAARSVVLAALGLAAASGAFAQLPPAANVAAFNPYTSGGWGAGVGQPRAYPSNLPTMSASSSPVDPNSATIGAFNPWRAQVQPPAANSPYGPYVDADTSANLPSPPPGPIRSRLLAVPQRGDSSTSRPLRPLPVNVATRSAPPSERPPSERAVVLQTPVPSRQAIVATPAPAPAPPEPAPPVGRPSPAARVLFDAQSAELSGAARSELDRIAQTITSKGTRQIELRAYAGGSGPESRKISLARALAVRSYLIDRGVKSRIDVGAFLAEGVGGSSERVDVVAPNT